MLRSALVPAAPTDSAPWSVIPSLRCMVLKPLVHACTTDFRMQFEQTYMQCSRSITPETYNSTLHHSSTLQGTPGASFNLLPIPPNSHHRSQRRSRKKKRRSHSFIHSFIHSLGRDPTLERNKYTSASRSPCQAHILLDVALESSSLGRKVSSPALYRHRGPTNRTVLSG